MKRIGNLYQQICSIDNLRLAHKNARKGRGWYQEVKMVDGNLDYYLQDLQEMLRTHTYHTSQYTSFIRHERGKDREIFKLPYYPDRICQWAILQVIEPYILRNLTPYTYSAIPGKGIHAALHDVQRAMWTDIENCQYCLKLDVRKYYPSINHKILKEKFRKIFKDPELLWILDEIIDSISTYPATAENIEILQRLGVSINIVTDTQGREFVEGVGIPIGNYLSQYCGNFYLSAFDHWIKEEKQVKYAFRYMDDIVIFGNSKERLHELRKEIDEYFQTELKVTIKSNWQVFPSYVRGVDFVGYRTFLHYTLLRKSCCITFKKKMLAFSDKRVKNLSPNFNEWCSFNSYLGVLKHCDSYRLYLKYAQPNVEYMYNYYLKEVKGNAEICKNKELSRKGVAVRD